MKFTGITSRVGIAGICASGLLGGVAATMIGAPAANAAPDCSASEVSRTVSATSDAARAYLDTHPGANQAVSTAFTQPRAEAAATLRGYFTSNPGEYNDLRGILAPIGDTQRSCDVTALAPELASAYDEFMAG
ncbi:heme-binding protein [Mycobacterium sp. NPDC003449]